jgi:hypothetical protein
MMAEVMTDRIVSISPLTGKIGSGGRDFVCLPAIIFLIHFQKETW